LNGVRQTFGIAARNLVQRKRRTLLLGGVTAAVTAVLVLLTGLSSGVRAVMLRSGLALSSGHVNVGGFFKTSPGQASAVVTHAPQVREIIQELVPELDHVAERGRGYVTLIGDTRSLKTDVVGVDLRAEPWLHDALRVKEGVLEAFTEPGTMVLFEDQARKLKAKVGDRLTVLATTFRGAQNTADLRLVAIVHNIGIESTVTAFIHMQSWRQLYQLKDESISVFHLYLKDLRAAAAVKGRLREKLQGAGYRLMPDDPRIYWMKIGPISQQDWMGQKLDLTTWEDEQAVLRWLVRGLNALSGVLVFFLMALISVGMTNSMWIAIRERTKEIGTLRAIGMSRFRVLCMFLAEGFLLGLFSTALGAVVGAVAGTLLNRAQIPLPMGAQLILMAEHLHFQLEVGTVLSSALIITAALTFISLIPAFLAARLKPATAFSHV
jgi:putative ABC transport system permease protein